MYSYKDRLKAVKLCIKYGFCVADTLYELGYPSRNMLRRWYQEYADTGKLHKPHGNKSKLMYNVIEPEWSVHNGLESGGIPLYNSDEDQSAGGMVADDSENVDLIEGVDEDGNTILLEVIRYFFYNGEEFVILGEAQPTDHDHDHSCCEHEECSEEVTVELYVMKVVPSEEDDDMEEFVPVEDEDLLEQLIRVAEATFDEDEPDGEEDES